MNGVLIVIVSYNAKRYMQECIYSIRDSLEWDSYKIVVVDNASTDGVNKWLSEQSDILFIQNTENIGFGPACNQAVRSTIGTVYEEYDVFLLNNDTVLNRKSLPRLIEALNQSESIGAVGAVSNYAGNRQQLEISFDSVEEYSDFGERLSIDECDRYLEKIRLNGFALLVKRKVWEETGGFDEDFAPGYYEDDALSMEILRRGYKLILARDSFIYHAGSVSFAKTGKTNLSYDHHQLFIQKYGFDILDYVYPCGAVISRLPFKRDESFTFLHVGCGLGAEIKAIESLFCNAKGYGIEDDEKLYSILENNTNVFENVEQLKEEFPDNAFDALILDDNYLLNISQQKIISALCKPDAFIITRIHKYDDFSFDDLKVVAMDGEIFDENVSSMLAYHGIICIPYSNINIKEITYKIDSMGILDKRILFISDSTESHNGKYKTVGSDIMPYLNAFFARLPISDMHKDCMNQYSLFEKKYEKSGMSDKKILITINKNCLEKVRELSIFLKDCELLNYTKTYLSEDQLRKIIVDDWNECAYITARDEDTEYGVIGFYALNKRSLRLKCFSFSYVVTGLGIAQFVYNKLGRPEIEIVAPVIALSEGNSHYDNILESCSDESAGNQNYKASMRILLKLQKSFEPVANYIIGGNITTEYTDKEVWNDILPSKIFTGTYNMICYSLLQYSFNAWNDDSDSMIGKLFDTLEGICTGISSNTIVVLLLGSEKQYDNCSYDENKLFEIYREINPIIIDFVKDNKNIKVIRMSDFIDDQSDFYGSINVFTPKVYSDITAQICDYTNQLY